MAFEGESTAPSGTHYGFHPRNFRETIQRSISVTVDRQIDALVNLSIGDFDGRFLGNFPAEPQHITDVDGNLFHIVGFSRGGDGSVAAP